MLELYIYIRIIEYLCARPIYSYKSALANIALWPTISSSFSRFLHRKNQQSNIYLDDSFPITNLRILYIYTHTYSRRIRLVIEERWISSGSIGRDDWPTTGCFHHGWRIFARSRLITANRIQISRQSRPRSIDSLRLADNSPCLRSD